GSGVVESEPESASESDPESEPELEPEPARLGGEDGARAPEDGVRGVVDGGAGLVLSSAASAELSCAGSSGRESGSANQPVTSRPSSDSARAVPAAVPASIPRWRRASWTTACTRWRPLLESRPSRLIRVQVSVETSRRAPSRRPYGRAGHRLRIPPAPSEGNTPTARHAAPSSRLCARSSPISRPRPRSTSAMIPGSHSARRWYEPVMGYSRAGKWVNRRNRERRRGWVNRRNRERRRGWVNRRNRERRRGWVNRRNRTRGAHRACRWGTCPGSRQGPGGPARRGPVPARKRPDLQEPRRQRSGQHRW